jgi:hypothetical protein
MSGGSITSCQIAVSTIFTFGTLQSQTADNAVYFNRKGDLTSSIAGTLPAGRNHDCGLVFKSDYERLQYLLGLYGRSSVGLR